MKMLIRDEDRQYLQSLKERLEENGIPSFVQGEETARMIVPVLLRPTLWVYIDDQFDDALELIHNPDHVVRIRIDVEEFYKLQPPEREQRRALNKVLIQVLLFLLALMAGIYLVIRFLATVNS